jgi:hypothetical protein
MDGRTVHWRKRSWGGAVKIRRFVLALVAAMSITFWGAPGASAATWVRQSSPSLSDREAGLESVACPTATSCFAAGYSTAEAGPARRFLEQYHGGSWSIVAAPAPAGDTLFFGVACSGVSFCVAVGEGPTSVLIDRWNGSSWSTQSAPAPTGSFLRGVTCPSVSSCWAVGGTGTSPGHTGFIEHWNGNAWSRVSAVSTPSNRADVLTAVACVNASDCTAVGLREDVNGDSVVLVEHWSGASWSARTAPSVAGRVSELLGVACPASNGCWAVGESFLSGGSAERRLVERWDGISWSIVVTPAPGTETRFASISCAGGQCVAVGWTDHLPLADRWSGSAWTTEAVPGAGFPSVLEGVKCVSANECVAVGADGSDGTTLVERSS